MKEERFEKRKNETEQYKKVCAELKHVGQQVQQKSTHQKVATIARR